MADVYVWSGATGAGTGADWANAYLTLQVAAAAKAPGDVFYVAHDHYQTQSTACTIAFTGTELLPCAVYCVDRAGSVPPVVADLRETALIETSGAAVIAINNSLSEVYGIIFAAGVGASGSGCNPNNTVGRTQRYVNCQFKLMTTNGTTRISPGSTGPSATIWENCIVRFNAAGQFILPSGRWFWRNSPNAVQGTAPSSLMSATNPSIVIMEGVDLTGCGAGFIVANNSVFQTVTLINCKMGTNYKIANPTTGTWAGPQVTAIRSDAGDTTYKLDMNNYAGALSTETTIVRSGGASDGTTPISWKVVTTATSKWSFPFDCLPITVWNETVGTPVTVTVQGTGAAIPNNDEIWIDCEYMGTSGFPIFSKATSTKANLLAAPAALPAGSGTWGGGAAPFAMAATFTPQEKGPITIYVRVAKPSSTFYVDPKPVLS